MTDDADISTEQQEAEFHRSLSPSAIRTTRPPIQQSEVETPMQNLSQPTVDDLAEKPRTNQRRRMFPFIFDAQRLCLLTDGIMAVAITLLVLDLAVPDSTDPAVDPTFVYNYLMNTLYAEVLLYLGVVLILAFYWIEHAHIFSIIIEANSFIVVMNSLFLVSVAFLPYCFKIVSYWPTQYYSSLIIFVVLCVMDMSLLFMWLYATRNRRFCLNEEQLPKDVINVITLNLVILLVTHLLGMILATITWLFTIILLALIPLLILFSAVGVDFVLMLYLSGKRIMKRRRAPPTVVIDPDNNVELQPAQGVYARHDAQVPALTGGEKIRLFFSGKHFRHCILERLAFFSDAMFAIIITVLVLEMRPPIPSSYLHYVSLTEESSSKFALEGFVDISPHNTTASWNPFFLNDQLGHGMGIYWSQYVSYVITAIVTITLWKHHVSALQGLKKANRFFCMWNIFFLGVLALIPFTTYVISRYYMLSGTAVPYSLILCISTILLLTVFFMAHYTSLSRKVEPEQRHWKMFEAYRLVVIMLISAISFGISWVNTYASVAIAIVIPLLDVLATFPPIDILMWSWKLCNMIGRRKQPSVPHDTPTPSMPTMVDLNEQRNT
ncbi:12 TM domain-containing transmembrane protein [Acrasis kona]|uniref:Endosomal/lysosomal proton channel TMEM175 n=1 Tax=Acrasis kona TaxID=1008807 RepID=A0AAW2Z0R2_9EUKA